LTSSSRGATAPSRSEWRSVVAAYENPDAWRAVAQLLTTVLPLFALYYVMYLSLQLSYWVTLLLAIPTAGLLVRTFVLMHDCSHGSFFASRRLNETVGFLTGVLTLTPFARWRHDHAMHHASSGDLDRRGHGDVPTLTVDEYLARTPFARLRYRLFRHPFVMIMLGPILVVMSQRFPRKKTRPRSAESRSVVSTNLAALGVVVALGLWVGFLPVAAVFLPVMYLAALAGVWLFYVQHQFENTYWRAHGEWDFARAAIEGSSFFKLPQPLRWLTASIGLHHVHHLGPRIPNYRLQRAHDENPIFHEVTVLTFAQSIRTLRLSLWDAEREMLVGFDDPAVVRGAGLPKVV
jgi:omega-6 fatty acid desaturase (delta-12 desaturase)